MEKVDGGRVNNTGTTRQSGVGRDQSLVHPTMCASFLAEKGGSSISEAEAAGIVSSGGRKPLLSIRLENRKEDYVMTHLNVDCTCSVNTNIRKCLRSNSYQH